MSERPDWDELNIKAVEEVKRGRFRFIDDLANAGRSETARADAAEAKLAQPRPDVEAALTELLSRIDTFGCRSKDEGAHAAKRADAKRLARALAALARGGKA